MSHYEYLNTNERESILFMPGEGKGIRAIAMQKKHIGSEESVVAVKRY